MLSLSEILLLTIIYCFAYGFGVFISKLWWWLRIVIFIIICRGIAYQFNDFETLNLPVFLVVIMPMVIMAVPSLKQLYAPRLGFSLNPFRWISEKISMRRYTAWQEQERLREQQARKDELERLERLMRMQAEEAEKQRQFEREKAEREARQRAEENANKKSKQEQTASNSAFSSPRNPYDILGVSRDSSIEEIRKAYTELSKKYHPDCVSHLGVEFQKMAHEKYIEIKDAWDKIKRERGVK